MMEEIDRFQVPAVRAEMQPLDPTAASISDRDCDTREGETVAMNYKPSPLQVKLEKQRELARKGSLKNGNMGSPVNQQPKKNNVMARTRLVVPNKGYSSLDQSPDEKPLVALDTDSDDDFDMSRYSSSGYSSAERLLNLQFNKGNEPALNRFLKGLKAGATCTQSWTVPNMRLPDLIASCS
ncbi:protein FAM219A isoform 3-T3 [Alca torda]